MHLTFINKTVGLALLIACTGVSALAQAAQTDTLRFGTALGYAPYEYRGSDGRMTGFEIDLGNAICQNLHKKCVWVETEISTMIPALQARKYDAILASIGITAARQKLLLFTDKVHGGNSRLIARQGSAIGTDIATLRGKNIGVEQGTNNESFAKKKWAPEGVKITSYGNQDLAYNDLSSGRLEAVMTGEVQGRFGFLDTEKGKGYAFAGPAINDPLLGTGVSAIGVSKDNPPLVAEINRALAALRADGTNQNIAKKYFPPSIDVYGE